MTTSKFLFALFFLLGIATTSGFAQNTPQTDEKIWIVTLQIKEASKADFEKWMTDIFWTPMKNNQDPILKKQYAASRWLCPVRLNEDKIWTYAFFIEPVIKGADYDIAHYLVNTYGEEKGNTYLKQYDGFMAGTGQVLVFKRP